MGLSQELSHSHHSLTHLLLVVMVVWRVVVGGRGCGLVGLADRRRGGRGGASGVGAELDRRRCRGLQSGWVQSAFTSQRKERKNAENISPTCITFSKSVRKIFFPEKDND